MESPGLITYRLFRHHTSDRWGFKITTFDNRTYITEVYGGTPAAKAGVGLNEIIVTINRVPCDYVPHDYIYHVIRKVDHRMTLVTRKPAFGEYNGVDQIAKAIPVNDYYMNRDCGDFETSDEVDDYRRPSKRSRTGENHKPRSISCSPSESGRKIRPPSLPSTSESYLKKRRNNEEFLMTVQKDGGDNERKHRHHNGHTNGREAAKQPTNSTKKENRRKPHENGDGHHEKQKGKKGAELADRTLSCKAKKPPSFSEDKLKCRTCPKEASDFGKPGDRHERSNLNESAPRTSETQKGQPIGSTSRESPLSVHSNFSSSGETNRLIKAKSTANLSEVKLRHDRDVMRRQTAAATESDPRLRPGFPSMIDLRSKLPAGKRRTLLLTNKASLEDRITLLNSL